MAGMGPKMCALAGAACSAPDVIVVRGLASARVEPMTELARAAAPA
jgi:hypothetical protein